MKVNGVTGRTACQLRSRDQSNVTHTHTRTHTHTHTHTHTRTQKNMSVPNSPWPSGPVCRWSSEHVLPLKQPPGCQSPQSRNLSSVEQYLHAKSVIIRTTTILNPLITLRDESYINSYHLSCYQLWNCMLSATWTREIITKSYVSDIREFKILILMYWLTDTFFCMCGRQILMTKIYNGGRIFYGLTKKKKWHRST